MRDEKHEDAVQIFGAQPDVDAICISNLLDSPGAIIFFKDLQSRFIRVSVDCARLTGRTPNEMLGLSDFELDPTDHAHGSELSADEQRIIATGEPMVAKEELDRLPSRSHTWVETSKFPLRDSEGTIIGTFGISHEVTRWELAEQKIVRMAKEAVDAHTELMRVEGQLRAVLNGSTDVIAKYDRGLRYQYINPAGERFRGLTLDQLIGRTDRETGMTESSLQVYEPALNRVLETGERGDVELCVPNGPDRQDEWFNIVLSPDHDTTGVVVGVLTSMRDITEVKRAELALAHQAMHDSLTGLANRHLLTDRLNQALMRMERVPSSLALFFIDLDYFKVVNDTYGHAVGDRVLVDVARRLEQAVRREDTVARLGGDEFIVLCDRVITNDEVYEIADRFVRTLAIPFARGTETVRMSASVGVVVTDDPQAGTSELMTLADSAMYRAKEGGRSRFEILSSKDIEPHMRSPRARSDISPGMGTMSGMSRPIPAPSQAPPAAQPPWWRQAVIYQIYPRSWADGNGDGIGDLPGITARLPYLRDLGVDAIWLSPFYVSPQADAGYDVADYRDVDPIFGTLADADTLLSTAHDLGLKVIVDLVPNHSSDEHPWFQAALAAGPGSPERERYWFRDGRGPGGDLPPNNWLSAFGGAAWTRVESDKDKSSGTDGQWYLHLFATKQPDFNWGNPQVLAEFEDVLRFWLDRGVDGFRVDAADALIKQAGLPDWDEPLHLLGDAAEVPHDLHGNQAPMWDQDGVHEIYRAWRQILNSYNPIDAGGHSRDNDRILCAEACVNSQERAARYVRDDEMHQAFNLRFMQTQWRADDLRDAVTSSFTAADSVGAPTTWVLSNHDGVRHASRFGLPVGTKCPNGIGVGDPQPDAALGLRRARAATALMLALPGSSYLYQGEELGLPDSTDMPDDVRQDRTWTWGGHAERGRDGCRVPMPWEGDRPSYGFGPSDRTWLPQPASYAALAVDRQAGAPGTTLELYRALLAARREHRLGAGSLSWLGGYPEEVLAFANEPAAGERVLVITNLGAEPVPVPGGAQILVASGPLTPQGLVPTDTTVWLSA